MSIGMTYEQYWYGDPLMVKAFLKADKFRQERQNSEAWLQGMYIYDAISRLFPFPAVLADGKKMQQHQYMEEPYKIQEKETPDHVDEEINEKKKAQARGLQAMLYGK